MRNELDTENITCFLVSSTIFFDHTSSKAEEPIPLAAQSKNAIGNSNPGDRNPMRQAMGLKTKERVLRSTSPFLDAKKRANTPNKT